MLGIAAITGLTFAALLILISRQPEEFRVSRFHRIQAPPEKIFPHVHNLRRWDEWSPWAKLDPHAKVNFSDPAEGQGASMSWVGNKKIGEGQVTITESSPHERIVYKLEFVKPFKGVSTAEFTFTPDGDGTKVTWAMFGTNNFIAKVVSLVMNCEKMMGPQFEQGLRQLESAVSKA